MNLSMQNILLCFLPYKFENDVFYQAKVHCAKASNLLIASKNSLHDDIDILYAILLRYEGKLNDSVELLKKCLITN